MCRNERDMDSFTMASLLVKVHGLLQGDINKLVVALGMFSENMERIRVGQATAYSDKAFTELAFNFRGGKK